MRLKHRSTCSEQQLSCGDWSENCQANSVIFPGVLSSICMQIQPCHFRDTPPGPFAIPTIPNPTKYVSQDNRCSTYIRYNMRHIYILLLLYTRRRRRSLFFERSIIRAPLTCFTIVITYTHIYIYTDETKTSMAIIIYVHTLRVGTR